MGRKKINILVVLVFLGFLAHAQKNEGQNKADRIVRKGQLYGGISFAYGLMLEKTQNVFIQGDLGYMLNDFTSFRGDAYYFVNSVGKRPRFDMNHQIFLGADFHWTNNSAFTPHAGIQPGLALSRSSEYKSLEINNGNESLQKKISVAPVISTVFGCTYHAPKYFYMFVEGRYLFGIHMADTYPTHLDEIRFQFGLGWFVNFKN